MSSCDYGCENARFFPGRSCTSGITADHPCNWHACGRKRNCLTTANVAGLVSLVASDWTVPHGCRLLEVVLPGRDICSQNLPTITSAEVAAMTRIVGIVEGSSDRKAVGRMFWSDSGIFADCRYLAVID